MKLTRKKIGKLCPVAAALLMGGLLAGNSQAEQAGNQQSVFDLVVQEAVVDDDVIVDDVNQTEQRDSVLSTVDRGWLTIVPNSNEAQNLNETQATSTSKTAANKRMAPAVATSTAQSFEVTDQALGVLGNLSGKPELINPAPVQPMASQLGESAVKIAAKLDTDSRSDASENITDRVIGNATLKVEATVDPVGDSDPNPLKPLTSVWDAMPVTLTGETSSTGETVEEKDDQGQKPGFFKTASAPSTQSLQAAQNTQSEFLTGTEASDNEASDDPADDTTSDPVSNSAKEILVAMQNDGPVLDNGSDETEDKTDKKTESEEKETSEESAKSDEAVQSDKSEKSEESVADGAMKKEDEELAADSKATDKADDKTEATVAETTVAEDVAGRANSRSASDMATMLNAVEQENIEEKARESEVADLTEVESEDLEAQQESQTESRRQRKEAKPALEVVAQPLPERKVIVPAFDEEDDDANNDNAKKRRYVDASRIGDPFAKDKIKLMYDEIINGLKARNMSGRYELWKNYARGTLRGTAGLNTGSEVDGRCRLTWYTQLFRDPIFSVFSVEEFSRELFDGLSGSHRHIAETMRTIRKKLDVSARNDQDIRFPKCETPLDAVNEVKRCLLEAQMAHARALSVLSASDLKEIGNNFAATFCGPNCVNGHTIPNRTYGRRIVNIAETIDKAAMHDAAEALLPLTNEALLALLDQLPEDAFSTTYIGGQEVQRIATSAGDIIIGGRENNIYDLDSPEMRNVVCVIDLGGDDVYREGTCNLDRPVLVIIDLHGNDTYTGSKPGIQGGSILGVSLLIDCEGNDNYMAQDIAQGSSLGGFGMLLDCAGNDNYRAFRRCQGHALCGVGILVDRDGNDKYRAALWAQGFGAPGGFGVLNDVKGNDHYYCGGHYLDSYPEHPGYDGWGQGIGAGIRQVANGGIGAILDGSGDDVYEVDYFGHGGGYWLGMGFARDFGGNDIRHGTTLNAYNGGPRTQNRWTRFANGFGCHYSLGYCFDDGGNDTYGGTIMGTGMAWDLSIGFLCDFNGDNRFTATGGMTQGVGAEGSIGVLFCYGGNDVFLGRNQAYASPSITYHSPSNCGSNFSFLINYGGNNQYGCGAKKGSYITRGTAGGYLIDRPTEEEEVVEIVRLKKMKADRDKEIADWDAEQQRLRDEATKNKQRYVQRTRRPAPININLEQRVSAVPSFEKRATRTGNAEVNVIK